MGLLSAPDLPESFGPFEALRESMGFLPNLFRAQTLLPRLIEAQAGIAETVLLQERALSRTVKECILLTVAAAEGNIYCTTAHWNILRDLGFQVRDLDRMIDDHRAAPLPPAEVALLDFALKLSQHPNETGLADVERLRSLGFTDEAVLETMLVTALTRFLCTMSVGLGVAPDFDPKQVVRRRRPPDKERVAVGAGPYLESSEMSPEPYAFFEKSFGFVPNIFRAQTLRPDVVECEARAVGTVLLTSDVLTRVQKEYILLVVSATNLNTYCVAVHCEMLRNLGIPEVLSDQIALDHRFAGLSDPDVALLDFALKLTREPEGCGLAEVETLRNQGFSDPQILEAVAMTSLSNFLNTLQKGLGTVPDFTPRLVFEKVNPSDGDSHRTERAPSAGAPDEDAVLVDRVRSGDVAAFGELVQRHSRKLYRTLVGLTGRTEEVEDDLQNAFVKAFQNLHQFRGESRFSTWLTRIAINEGLQRLRGSKSFESIDDFHAEESSELAYPRRLLAWVEDPESLYSRKEMRTLVETEVMKLPAKYRVPVLLRDLELLSGEETAAALGVPIATMKTRLLRGRLMLREALAPNFLRREGVPSA